MPLNAGTGDGPAALALVAGGSKEVVTPGQLNAMKGMMALMMADMSSVKQMIEGAAKKQQQGAGHIVTGGATLTFKQVCCKHGWQRAAAAGHHTCTTRNQCALCEQETTRHLHQRRGPVGEVTSPRARPQSQTVVAAAY
jgi:hypothetical protein